MNSMIILQLRILSANFTITHELLLSMIPHQMARDWRNGVPALTCLGSAFPKMGVPAIHCWLEYFLYSDGKLYKESGLPVKKFG